MTDGKGISDKCGVTPLDDEHRDDSETEAYWQGKLEEPRYLHYSPVGSSKILKRSEAILRKCIDRNICLMIVDVSVEVAALMRVSSIPYAYVRLFGDRTDIPHIEAYKGATFLLAYFPRHLEPLDTPDWVKEKTLYLGFVSQYSGVTTITSSNTSNENEVAYITGSGGGSRGLGKLRILARANPSKSFYVIGQKQRTMSDNIIQLGYVKDVGQALNDIDTVIIAPGMNLTSEMLHLGKKIYVDPEDRPHNEQVEFAKALVNNSYANYLPADNIINGIKAINKKMSHSTNHPFKSLVEWTNCRNGNISNMIEDISRFGELSQIMKNIDQSEKQYNNNSERPRRASA
jgi:hypothetical protein